MAVKLDELIGLSIRLSRCLRTCSQISEGYSEILRQMPSQQEQFQLTVEIGGGLSAEFMSHAELTPGHYFRRSPDGTRTAKFNHSCRVCINLLYDRRPDLAVKVEQLQNYRQKISDLKSQFEEEISKKDAYILGVNAVAAHLNLPGFELNTEGTGSTIIGVGIVQPFMRGGHSLLSTGEVLDYTYGPNGVACRAIFDTSDRLFAYHDGYNGWRYPGRSSVPPYVPPGPARARIWGAFQTRTKEILLDNDATNLAITWRWRADWE